MRGGSPSPRIGALSTFGYSNCLNAAVAGMRLRGHALCDACMAHRVVVIQKM